MGRPANRLWFSRAESGSVPRSHLQRRFDNGYCHFFFYECRLIANQDGARQFRLSSFEDLSLLKRSEPWCKPFDKWSHKNECSERARLCFFLHRWLCFRSIAREANTYFGASGVTIIAQKNVKKERSSAEARPQKMSPSLACGTVITLRRLSQTYLPEQHDVATRGSEANIGELRSRTPGAM